MNSHIANFDHRASYSQRELSEMADLILREDAKSEICRECGGMGEKTGLTVPIEQPVTDAAGNALVVDFPEYQCGSGHSWFEGEGATKGIGGKDPILFEEHFQSRRRREIYNSLGAPDPSIVSGMYNRAHPQGRKINSPEARAKHGASYYR